MFLSSTFFKDQVNLIALEVIGNKTLHAIMPEQVLLIDLLVYRVARGQYKKCLSPGMQTEFRGEGGKNQTN